MENEQVSIRHLMARVQIGNFKSYLIERGWEESPSRYADHIYFQGEMHEGGRRYELYLPIAANVPKYQSTMMRAVYKLCGIEDREPQDIARDVIASEIPLDQPAAGPVAGPGTKTRLRVCNSGPGPLQLRIDSPKREHEMLPGEAIELVCDVATTGSLEINHGNNSLTILTSGRN
jgi:hypothetical protein